MRTKTIVCLLLMLMLASTLLLAGCSTGSSDDVSCRNIEYGYAYEQIDAETGVTLLPTDSVFLSFDEIVDEYKDIEACLANNNTPGPTILFTSFQEAGWTGIAFYVYPHLQVYMNTDMHPQSGNANLVRGCISDRELLRHEFTHHILYLNGEDPGHTNSKFSECDALGPKTCNGEYCD